MTSATPSDDEPASDKKIKREISMDIQGLRSGLPIQAWGVAAVRRSRKQLSRSDWNFLLKHCLGVETISECTHTNPSVDCQKALAQSSLRGCGRSSLNASQAGTRESAVIQACGPQRRFCGGGGGILGILSLAADAMAQDRADGRCTTASSTKSSTLGTILI